MVKDELVINHARREVTVNGKDLQLSPMEYSVLVALAAKPGSLVPHQSIITDVWGESYLETGGVGILKRLISRLRLKLRDAEKVRIVSKRGFGYILDGQVRSQ